MNSQFEYINSLGTETRNYEECQEKSIASNRYQETWALHCSQILVWKPQLPGNLSMKLQYPLEIDPTNTVCTYKILGTVS